MVMDEVMARFAERAPGSRHGEIGRSACLGPGLDRRGF